MSRARVPRAGQDSQLVLQAQRGDQRAFEALVRLHERYVTGLVCSIVRNPTDAEDAIQEVWLRVVEHLGRFDGRASFKTWLHQIARNLSIDAWRRRCTRSHEPLEDHEPADRRQAPDPLLQRQLERAVGDLSESHRMVWSLRELDGLTMTELQRRIGVPKGTVLSRLHHARNKLQDRLKEAV
jgi:RNA polymerase sigma-70 factor (ECF subfamily)